MVDPVKPINLVSSFLQLYLQTSWRKKVKCVYQVRSGKSCSVTRMPCLIPYGKKFASSGFINLRVNKFTLKILCRIIRMQRVASKADILVHGLSCIFSFIGEDSDKSEEHLHRRLCKDYSYHRYLQACL